ncbi:MAG TPA: NAD-dependent epimerase/dehydratase family protein [Ruania sp.]|nr:NAD-dependent epimerase/dehydratase family protein [Ruania sp.]
MSSVLFIGGTGQISAACVPVALQRGWDVTVLNRGASTLRAVPEEVRTVHADVRDPEAVRAVLGAAEFDAVADFTSFTPEHAATAVDLFSGRTGQYLYISSASAYQTPPARLPVTEETPLDNPYWQYSRDKAASEELLRRAHAERGFPVTVVRPSHTFDRTRVPTVGGWTDVERLRRGAPVVVVGDGTTLWTITRAADFAIGFVGLLGRSEAIGEAFHITSDLAPTWNELYQTLGRLLGVEAQLVHAPAEVIAAVDTRMGGSLLGDKAHSFVLDNSKIRALVPEFAPTATLEQGLGESIEWYLADPARQGSDAHLEAVFDEVVRRA